MYAVARRYVKAALKVWSNAELGTLLENLELVAAALENEKFATALSSPSISTQEKCKWVLNLTRAQDKRVQNLLCLLVENKRLDALASICTELSNHLNACNKTYQGVIYAKEMLEQDAIISIEKNLAKHLGVELVLSYAPTQKDEISLAVEGLGVEISFSNERFLEDLKSHILKAI